jgi:hypothetical protein
MPARPGEGFDLAGGGGSQRPGRGPAFGQPQEHRGTQVTGTQVTGTQVTGGDVDGGGEDGQQVGAQPVADPSLVAGGALVIAGACCSWS